MPKRSFAKGSRPLWFSLFVCLLALSSAQPAWSQPEAEDTPAAEAPSNEGTETPESATAAPPAEVAPAPQGTDTDVPVDLRLKRLEQRVQGLKERAWRAKARVGMLKESVLGGGIGARASVTHVNEMGSSYRLLQLVYALDGNQVFSRNDSSGEMHDVTSFDVLTGPITPGSHTLSVMAVYRGHGYGVFRYLNKYRFTVRASHTFNVEEGKGTSIKVVAYEKGGITTPLEQRPAFEFKLTSLVEK